MLGISRDFVCLNIGSVFGELKLEMNVCDTPTLTMLVVPAHHGHDTHVKAFVGIVNMH